jgi:hypothetical protein
MCVCMLASTCMIATGVSERTDSVKSLCMSLPASMYACVCMCVRMLASMCMIAMGVCKRTDSVRGLCMCLELA